MYSQKFSQFEIGQPLLMSYNDGSFYILQKVSKSKAKVICIDKKENPIFRDLEVGITITKISANSIYGKILK
jgi:cobalamin biosynthesis Co2+ chelatase CbiK